ncbi:MAG TPA: tRNA(Met) cytidine acetyltransferase [Leucothrix mucor]|nr:tRNA(Met) cytidine acetyltransferase [Leucothrix mucor]
MKATPSNFHRQIIVISGLTDDCIAIASSIVTGLDNSLWLSNTDIAGHTSLSMSKASTVLGQEYDAVIFDTFTDGDAPAFNANAFGAVTGTIIGGGYLILLTPELSTWAKKSRFLARFITLLQQSSALFYDKEHLPAALSPPSKKPLNHTPLLQEQQLVVDKMQTVMSGHRRRPLVLTSDRGRGKSTLLGKFAAHLLLQGKTNLIVTAPSRKIAETLFQAAKVTLQNSASMNSTELLKGLHFLSPDELHQQKPQVDLVLIDEAASIPIPLLEDFIKHHSRLILATTEHGYEGCGRGFAIRFRKILDARCPQWKSARLETPYRWAADDPLESFIFNTLLLKTELKKAHPLIGGNLKSYDIRVIHQDELLADEPLLGKLFALLLSAHYQTRPSDLVRLLDEENYQIFIMHSQQQLIATALVAQEGGFSQVLANEIYNGNRRPQGHMIPQTLATHAGVKDAPCYIGDRIMRIAVHPELQGKGVGSYLLQQIIKSSKKQGIADYIATSFGATPKLVSFWNKANFQAVHIGMKREASSGTHSVVMLKPLTVKADILFCHAQQNFSASFPLLLADPLQDLEAPLVAVLFRKLFSKNEQAKLILTNTDKHALLGFYEQQRGYESSISAIYKLTLQKLSLDIDLKAEELQIIIAKVLQKKSWHILVALTASTGQKQAIKLLRQSVKKLACRH